MIGWYTDNELSLCVMESIPGIKVYHINEFGKHVDESGFELIYKKNIFYGLLRGCGRAMHILQQSRSGNYFYIDNGYFDALYVDKKTHAKDMSGKFRVVKNGMHEVYPEKESILYVIPKRKLLIIPPSPYSANFYDTTPEDWVAYAVHLGTSQGWGIRVRYKDSTIPLEKDLDWCTGVLAFNSMVTMRAIEMEKIVCDTHGILRNAHKLNMHPGYDIKDMRAFYEPRQFTLEEFKQGKCTLWN